VEINCDKQIHQVYHFLFWGLFNYRQLIVDERLVPSVEEEDKRKNVVQKFRDILCGSVIISTKDYEKLK